MTENAFLDKSVQPTAALLSESLGPRAKYLDELKRQVPGPLVEQWKYYGKTIGWTLKLLQGKRNLCFIVARKNYFTVSFVFGDKAVAAVRQSRLPADLVQQLLDARKYVEGRGIRIEVKSHRALEHAKILLDIKQSA
jgi:hypothetical protein